MTNSLEIAVKNIPFQKLYLHMIMYVSSVVSAGNQRKWEQKLINWNDAMPYCSFPPATISCVV